LRASNQMTRSGLTDCFGKITIQLGMTAPSGGPQAGAPLSCSSAKERSLKATAKHIKWGQDDA